MMKLKCTAIVAVSFFCSIHLVPHRTFGQDQQSSARIVDRLARIRNLAILPDPIVRQKSETESRSESKSFHHGEKVAVTWLTEQPRRVQGVVPPQSDSQPRLPVDKANVPQTPDFNDAPSVDPVQEKSEPQVKLPDTVEPELSNQWPRRTILETRIDIRDFSQTRPKDRSAELIGKSQSDWSMFSPPPSIFTWAAPNIRYQPLYYQDIALERYGQTACGLRRARCRPFTFLHPRCFCRTPYTRIRLVAANIPWAIAALAILSRGFVSDLFGVLADNRIRRLK